MELISMAQNQVEPFPIAIIKSRFNEEICDGLWQGAKLRLQELGFAEHLVTAVEVPGAVEIPLMAMRMASSERYQAIIALGAVIRGETSHYDYVCSQVSEGCQRISLDLNIPIIFGVLTTENIEQARDRIGGAHGHKGKDAVDSAVEMMALLNHVQLS